MKFTLIDQRARQLSLLSTNIFPGAKRKGVYNDEYYTPDAIVRALGAFDIDPSAGPKAHASINIRHPKDGLAVTWVGRVWLNPPYSNIHEWLAKFQRHANGVALVNARTETQWFQRLCAQAESVLWLQGRVKFERPDGKRGNSTVGSVLVAYGQHNADALRKSGLPGIVMSVAHCIPNNCISAIKTRK